MINFNSHIDVVNICFIKYFFDFFILNLRTRYKK